MEIVMWMRVGVVAQNQLPYLNLGPSVPPLIIYKMEKPVFTNTMTWADYKDLIGAETKDFWSYTTKEGKKGWMSTVEVGTVKYVINVAKALYERFDSKNVETSDLRISSVVWPDKREALVLHKVGADTVSI